MITSSFPSFFFYKKAKYQSSLSIAIIASHHMFLLFSSFFPSLPSSPPLSLSRLNPQNSFTIKWNIRDYCIYPLDCFFFSLIFSSL
ncbi:unnamed protein product [Meloidogyne enterolobii]|uniref:Uncharacterized protein n=1 Tax=Meloidogyne enterolobii TaxID=390850 RepID=A0ACB0Y7C0_MELEN